MTKKNQLPTEAQVRRTLEQDSANLKSSQERLRQAKARAEHLEKDNAERFSLLEADYKQRQADIEEETDLLHKQLDALRDKVVSLGRSIENKQAEVYALDRAIGVLKDKENAQADRLTKTINDLTAEESELGERIADKQAAENDLDKRIASLSGDMGDLIAKKTAITIEIDRLRGAVEAEVTKLVTMRRDYDEKATQGAKKLKELSLALEEATKTLGETQDKDEEYRTGWATKAQELDLREQVVTKREYKVAKEEKRIQTVNDFMKL